MRLGLLVLAFCLPVSAGLAGMSGTYTIKPDGTGDFLSGNCVFELYGDTLSGFFAADEVAGSDSWATTFRPGPGQSPVIAGGTEFYGNLYYNVKLESLRFFRSPITAVNCAGWRISRCRITTHDWGVKLSDGIADTVDGNEFDVWGTGLGHYPVIMVESGRDNVIFNNFVNSDSCALDALVDLDHARNTRFVFNTLRQSPYEMDYGNCIRIEGEPPCELRDNVFVLARPADTINACVFISSRVMDSITLDFNCCFVESLGYVGERDSVPPVWYDWGGWRGFGFEANGISANPRLVGTTDLHLRNGSPCIGTGTSVSGIGFDIDGDPRDPVYPDIGADEFTGGAVGETPSGEWRMANSGATILTGTSGVKRLAACVVFDAMGRRVLNPRSGVFFIREPPAVGGRLSAVPVRKIVIQR
jgi:hypothetical protein